MKRKVEQIPKNLSKMTKPELIELIRRLFKDYQNLRISHSKLLKYSAALRHTLKIELDDRVNEGFWDEHLEDLVDMEFDEDGTDDMPEEMKKRIPDGYS